MKKLEEKVNVKKVIKDLADTDFSKSNEDQGKMASLFKGLAFSDDPEANKFMKYIDKCTTDYVKKKESLLIKGQGQKIQYNEEFDIELEEGKSYKIELQ